MDAKIGKYYFQCRIESNIFHLNSLYLCFKLSANGRAVLSNVILLIRNKLISRRSLNDAAPYTCFASSIRHGLQHRGRYSVCTRFIAHELFTYLFTELLDQ
jgi:hypothetical protein